MISKIDYVSLAKQASEISMHKEAILPALLGMGARGLASVGLKQGLKGLGSQAVKALTSQTAKGLAGQAAVEGVVGYGLGKLTGPGQAAATPATNAATSAMPHMARAPKSVGLNMPQVGFKTHY